MSIGIATYNAEAHIAAAIQSATRQTLAALEILVVDDGSTDATVSIVERLARDDPRIVLLRMARNGGPAAARNRALSEARGAWFAILDSDDLLAADRLERLVDVAEREGADLVADNLLLFQNDRPEEAAFFLDPTTVPEWIELADYLEHTVMFGKTPNLGYLKPVIRTARLQALDLRYDEGLRIAEDDDFVLRMLIAGLRYRFVSEAAYGYRRHASSTSHRLSLKNALAILTAADDLLADPASRQTAAVHAGLRRRRDAIDRAAAFTRLIDLIKQRRMLGAASVALCNPRMIPLLRMPLQARIERMLGRQAKDAPFDQTPAAAAALRRLRVSIGIAR